MGRQTVTPEQWLAGIEVADENPTIRDLASKTLQLIHYWKSHAEYLDRQLRAVPTDRIAELEAELRRLRAGGEVSRRDGADGP
jgi:hypothetical protein